ncbi:hypothetical protein [Muriicola soli]|uniref:Uncharacterized protein n=1 Tax=Muriicola soli TaxID=2507538 RepID=A0A411E7M9_9FLAO|nr:hypothetical protein [Muriicola soli]QBA63672.1 hypothetical protein EQY75_03385 [Muriicola soli]
MEKLSRKLIILLILSGLNICHPQDSSHDIVIKLNGEEIIGEILELGASEIKYRNNNNRETAVSKDSIFIIKKANGSLLKINIEDGPSQELITNNLRKYLFHYYMGLVYKNRASSSNSLADSGTAIAHWKKAINAQPTSDSAYYHMAMTKWNLALKTQDASWMDEFNKALELNPDKYEYRVTLIALIQPGLFPGKDFYSNKLIAIDEALKKWPEGCYLHQAKAEVLLNLDEYQEGLKEVNYAVENCEVDYDLLLIRMELNLKLYKVVKKSNPNLAQSLEKELGNDYLRILSVADGKWVPGRFKKFEKYAN